ncbi:MAG: TlpA disulfide reductase family protein [Verrucomicrobiota bacterium]
MKTLSLLCSIALLACPVLGRAQEKPSQPVDIKFTSIDGRAVDLAKLTGKVVLIDFWATWCPPCRAEVPHVVEAYKKLHDKGFEIIGISLDQNKEAVVEFVKKNDMTWPQYFDGKGWDNAISKKNGIDSIPAMWLIDKQGKLVTTDAREDLAGQVEKLLAK